MSHRQDPGQAHEPGGEPGAGPDALPNPPSDFLRAVARAAARHEMAVTIATARRYGVTSQDLMAEFTSILHGMESIRNMGRKQDSPRKTGTGDVE